MAKFLRKSPHVPSNPDKSKEVKDDVEAIFEQNLEPAEALRKLRVQKGWTCEELGQKLGLHGVEIEKMEEGEHPIDENTASKLAEIFQIDQNAFFGA